MKLFVFLLLTSVAFSQELTLVVYKKEYIMEMWVKGKCIKTYKICSMSGESGPKRTQGDMQVPEGIYKVVLFNSRSNYLLSFKINYPNASDKILGTNPLGGDIFFHGKCCSAGCVSFRDEDILKIYPAVKNYKKTNVLIFPTKLESFITLPEDSRHSKFWKSLKPILEFWEKNHYIPAWTLDSEGYYTISG